MCVCNQLQISKCAKESVKCEIQACYIQLLFIVITLADIFLSSLNTRGTLIQVNTKLLHDVR